MSGWLALCIAVCVVYVGATRPGLRLWDGVVTHGSSTSPVMALTFDDGPHPLWTPLLADTLAAHRARGAFFVVGMEAQRYPELTTRLTRAGHELGNHSLTHPVPNLIDAPPALRAHELDDSARVLRQLAGMPIATFRPPGGGIDDALLDDLRARGLCLAGWSQNAGDAAPISPALLADRLARARRSGAVVLLHQRDHTIAALEIFLADRRNDAYTYDTFSNVTRGREYAPAIR